MVTRTFCKVEVIFVSLQIISILFYPLHLEPRFEHMKVKKRQHTAFWNIDVLQI